MSDRYSDEYEREVDDDIEHEEGEHEHFDWENQPSFKKDRAEIEYEKELKRIQQENPDLKQDDNRGYKRKIITSNKRSYDNKRPGIMKTFRQQHNRRQSPRQQNNRREAFINCPRCNFSAPKIVASMTYIKDTNQIVIVYPSGNLDIRSIPKDYKQPITQQIYECDNMSADCKGRKFAFIQEYDGRAYMSRTTRTIPEWI